MEKKIITVSRQFGSGGRSIARATAEKLGIAYYDKEIVKQVALETGFDTEYIEAHGEHAPSTSRYAYAFSHNIHHAGLHGAMTGVSPAEFLWLMQREVILRLADKEPCVIVGRCADYILRDREDCLNVFIHASKEYRADRIVRLYGESENAPKKRLDEKDKKRKVNYRHFTDREWGDAVNYHVSLDSGVIGEEACVDIITRLYRGE